MKFFFLYLCLSVSLNGLAQQKQIKNNSGIQKHFEWSLAVLKNPPTKNILVSAHRCGWRNSPENSIQSLKECIAGGIDIAEFDLKKTKDGVLIVMHDKTIDRTTNGKGKPEDYTLKEIKKFRLRDGAGHITRHQIPTFEEMLITGKDKIILDIDKGFPYMNEALVLIEKYKMHHQVIYNIQDNLPFDTVLVNLKVVTSDELPCDHPIVSENQPLSELCLMTVVNPSLPQSDKIIKSFEAHPNSIIQTVFASDTVRILSLVPEIKKIHHVWFNALWPEHSAGHDDDIAVEENKPDESWGWLIEKGATIIQSDRPYQLLQYLTAKGLRPKFD